MSVSLDCQATCSNTCDPGTLTFTDTIDVLDCLTDPDVILAHTPSGSPLTFYTNLFDAFNVPVPYYLGSNAGNTDPTVNIEIAIDYQNLPAATLTNRCPIASYKITCTDPDGTVLSEEGETL